jgi:hypothetical protein
MKSVEKRLKFNQLSLVTSLKRPLQPVLTLYYDEPPENSP